jgi:hypothetical protein
MIFVTMKYMCIHILEDNQIIYIIFTYVTHFLCVHAICTVMNSATYIYVHLHTCHKLYITLIYVDMNSKLLCPFDKISVYNTYTQFFGIFLHAF